MTMSKTLFWTILCSRQSEMKMVILLVKFLLLTEFDEAMLIVILQFSKKNINIIADKVTKNAKKLKITAIDK